MCRECHLVLGVSHQESVCAESALYRSGRYVRVFGGLYHVRVFGGLYQEIRIAPGEKHGTRQ